MNGLYLSGLVTVRRRIETIQRRLCASGLPRWAVSMAILAGLSGAGLLGEARLVLADGESSDGAEDSSSATQQPLPKLEIPPTKTPFRPADTRPVKTISGRVTDAAGKRVADAQIWLPVRGITSSETLTAKVRSDAAGQFHLTVPKAWLPTETMRQMSILWAYAPGHAIATVDAHAQMFGDKPAEPCAVELPPASDISLVVRLPDGRLAAGAQLAPEDYQIDRAYKNYGYVPSELVEQITQTTDAEGRARFPALAREWISEFGVTHAGYGKQTFRVGNVTRNGKHWSAQAGWRPTDPAEREVTLRPVARIEGRIVADQLELARGMVVSVESFDPVDHSEVMTTKGTASVKVDELGRFVIPEIASGLLRVLSACDKRLPVQPRLPPLDSVALAPGQTLVLDIPLELCVRVHGQVRTHETGDPVPGAMIYVHYGVGHQGDYVVTDENGFYSTYALAGDVTTSVSRLPDGFVTTGRLLWGEPPHKVPPDAKEFEFPAIEMVPIVTVAGTLLDHDRRPMANIVVHATVGKDRYGSGKSDDQGAFSIAGVPAKVKLTGFELWQKRQQLKCVVESTDPLVLRGQAPARQNPQPD